MPKKTPQKGSQKPKTLKPITGNDIKVKTKKRSKRPSITSVRG